MGDIGVLVLSGYEEEGKKGVPVGVLRRVEVPGSSWRFSRHDPTPVVLLTLVPCFVVSLPPPKLSHLPLSRVRLIFDQGSEAST